VRCRSANSASASWDKPRAARSDRRWRASRSLADWTELLRPGIEREVRVQMTLGLQTLSSRVTPDHSCGRCLRWGRPAVGNSADVVGQQVTSHRPAGPRLCRLQVDMGDSGSQMSTLSAGVKLSTLGIETLRSRRSIEPMHVRWSSASFASASWAGPRSDRSALRRRAKRARAVLTLVYPSRI